MPAYRTINIKRDIPATLALLGATVSWGVVPIMLKYLATPTLVPDGFTSNLVRYPVACLLYLPFLVYGLRRKKLQGFLLIALIPTAANIPMQTLWAWAPYHLDATMFAFLIRLCVIWAILGAFVLFPDERRLARNAIFWVGSVLAFVGFIFMSVSGGLLDHRESAIGIAIMFVCSILWGAYGVLVRYAMGTINPLMAFSVISLYTSLAMILLAPLGQPASVLELNGRDLFILVLSSVLGVALAHGLFYYAVQRIGVAISGLMLMAAPFVTMIGANWLLGESFNLGQWVGGLVLIAGAIIAMQSRYRLAKVDNHNPRQTRKTP